MLAEKKSRCVNRKLVLPYWCFFIESSYLIGGTRFPSSIVLDVSKKNMGPGSMTFALRSSTRGVGLMGPWNNRTAHERQRGIDSAQKKTGPCNDIS